MTDVTSITLELCETFVHKSGMKYHIEVLKANRQLTEDNNMNYLNTMSLSTKKQYEW